MADDKNMKDNGILPQTNSDQQKEAGEQQNATFNEKDYGNDPNNMANYTGNYGTGTYDTDYGKGSFPETNAKEQGDNWKDEVGNPQQRGSDSQTGDHAS